VATDPQLAWRTVVTGDHLDLDGLPGHPELAGAEHVLLAVDRDRTGELTDLQHRLVAGGAEVGILGRCGDFVVAAPPAPATAGGGGPDWCWNCVRRSVVGSPAGDPAGLPPAVVPATMAALHLVQHLFTRLAEVRLDGAELVTSVEPVAPVVRTHVARRHPACERHASVASGAASLVDGVVRPDVPAAEDPADLVAASDRIVAVSTAWTDPVVGPLLALGEGSGDQLPLSVSTCRIADPTPAAGVPPLRDLACRAVSPREARNQVVLVAMEWAATRVARLRGLPRGHVLGAGWTPAEAVYRARMAASAAIPVGAPSWRRAACDPGSDGPLREFLAGSLAAAGREWSATAVADLPTGAVRALVRTADGRVAAAVGLDPGHAIDGALLRAMADGRPGAAALALLAPPVKTWAAALDRLAGGREPATDLGHMLPFLSGDAHLVAVPAPGEAR